jgi:predicted nucleic acid-binding protein
MTVRAKASPGSVAHWPLAVIGRLNAAILAITPFTLAEERFGYLKSGWGHAKVAEHERRLGRFLLIPLDLGIIDSYAALRFECQKSGLSFGYHDLWIGATARSRGIPLVSCDKSQCDIPGIEAIYLPPTP